jgi:hypothetical protein
MHSSKFALAFCSIVTGIIMSCSGGGQLPPDYHYSDFNDSTTPVVDIYTPTENQVFNSGDTIKIDGRVTDNSLYRGSVKITNDATGAVVKEQQYEIHGFQAYNFHVEYKTSVAAVSNYTVTVQYEDHGLNNGLKNVRVKVNP